MCEDFPACGHERGCCPDFDESGRQLNMVCTCGKKLPIHNRFSICDSCLNKNEDGEPLEDLYYDRDIDEDNEPHESYNLSDDGDALASAGFGTDEDYGERDCDFGYEG